MFKSDAERMTARKAHFDAMDDDGNGTISFNEWLSFTVEHIGAKVRAHKRW